MGSELDYWMDSFDNQSRSELENVTGRIEVIMGNKKRYSKDRRDAGQGNELLGFARSGVLLASLALPVSAFAICDDSVYCTAIGSFTLPSNEGLSNTGTGYAALYENTTGENNTAFGARALFTNSTGSGNTAVGYLTLTQNTTGFQNTAIGESALSSNVTGIFNTATGAGALYSNLIGNFNVATGDGALSRNTSGDENTAHGSGALLNNDLGSYNTAVGSDALKGNTTGNDNTASGQGALSRNTTGQSNTAVGEQALYNSLTGSYNTATGSDVLRANTSGRNNSAFGYLALSGNTTGIDYIALGHSAGKLLTTGSYNIDIGHVGVAAENKVIRLGTQGRQLKTFVAGIRGVNVTGGAAVLVSSTGQLGVQSSSRKYKEDIHPMGNASAALMKLRPVTFRYKDAPEGDQTPSQYGLIAEEVDAVMPDLVVRDEDGKPATVAYHVLPSLLLNEYQKQQEALIETGNKLAAVELRSTKELALLRSELADRDKTLASLRAEVAGVRELKAEMKALRLMTQQLMAATPTADSVGMR